MKVDTGLGHQLDKVKATVEAAEAAGYDGIHTAEMNHDPFLRRPDLISPAPL